MRTVYADERIEVATTGRNYDFIAMVENKTNDDIVVAPDIGGLFEEFTVPAKEWVGLLANDDGRTTLSALKKGRFFTPTKKEYEEEFGDA